VFQKMLLLIAVLAILSAAFLFWAKGRGAQSELTSSVDHQRLDTTQLRPLFEPSQDELEREAREFESRQVADREAAVRADALTQIDDALRAWRSDHSISSAATVLMQMIGKGDADTFSRAAGEIIEYHRATDFQTVSVASVADLIDSHMRLLPVSERSSGTLFWLREEISRLRSVSGVSAAQKHS
jgi:hypothetical protein